MTEDVKDDNLLSANYLTINESMITSSSASRLDNTLFVNSNMTVEGNCIYTTSLPAELASSFPEGTVLQILSDSTILAVPPIRNSLNIASDNPTIVFKELSFQSELINDANPATLSNLLVSSHQNEPNGTEVPICSEGNMSDIDLSFLTETEEPVPTSKSLNEAEVKELQKMIDIVNPHRIEDVQSNPSSIVGSNLELPSSNLESPKHIEGTTEDVVMIDVSKPIQLGQNSLIMVNGRKCILQQDSETGQVIAYPVKEPDKPCRRRGRPRKLTKEQSIKDTSSYAESEISADMSDEERKDGLLEIVNDDGSLVRRSSRKRKKAKVLKDYETGNLKQELGSDVEDANILGEIEILPRRRKHKGPGRPKKHLPHQPTSLLGTSNENIQEKRPRGRPRKPIIEKANQPKNQSVTEETQAFLVQTADGQTLMMQVPLSSMPPGVSLQDVAQSIANRLNIGLNGSKTTSVEISTDQSSANEAVSEVLLNKDSNLNAVRAMEPALQDHSIGSTTNFPNPDQLIDVSQTNDSVHSSNLEESTVNSVCQSEDVTLTGSKQLTNEPDNMLSENILVTSFSNAERAQCSDEDFCPNIPNSNTSSSDSSSILSSLPAQICANQAEEQDLDSNLTQEQFTKEFLIDGDFLKDKVNIHMLLQNVEASVEESVSQSKIQNCDEVNSSVLSEDLPLNSTDTFEYSLKDDKSNIRLNQEVSEYTDTRKNLENYSFLNYSTPDANCDPNADKEALHNLAIISSIEHDHDFLIQGKGHSNVSEGQITPASAADLNFIEMGVNKTETFQTILPLENITSILRSSSSDDNKCSHTVIPVSGSQELPEGLLPIILPSKKQAGIKECKICHINFTTNDELIQHFKAEHPKCICPQCNYMSEHAYVIKRHSLRHLSAGCVCKICGKRYKDHYILKMHVKMVHLPAEAVFSCDICNKKFTRKAHLKRHLRIHEPNRPYKCSLCSYRGCERSDITKHLLVHQTPKHKCDICGKSFRHLKNKELHVKRHFNKRDYKCGICDFYGYTFTDIRKHIERRHAGTKSHNCADCGLLFKNKETLDEHKNNGQCRMCLLDEELSPKDHTLLEEKTDGPLEDISLDVILDEPDQHQISTSVLDECIEKKLESPEPSSAVLSSIESILSQSQSGHLVINGFETSDLLTTETLSLMSAERNSSKVITLVTTNGKSFSLPSKDAHPDSLEKTLSRVESSNEENFFLSEIKIEATP